jgi:hypothetical protein
MLINIEIEDYSSSFDLALIQWYDFRYKNDTRQLYKYDCPLLQLLNMFNFVPVELIIELVQVIQHVE